MTIVVAGYEGDEIFIIADSAITSGRKTLISGFKKIYSIPIVLHKPYILRTFRNYSPFRSYEGESVIALAGSTLTAQHVINTIAGHLDKIRFIHDYDSNGIKYSLIRHCNTRDNPFYRPEYTEYDDSVYLDNDLYKSINIDDIKNVIQYSIEEALSSASKHICDETDWSRIINNEYLFTLNCPKTRKNFLYKVELNEVEIDGLVKAVPNLIEIPRGGLGIIGIKDYENELNDLYIKLAKTPAKISLEMLSFVEKIIDDCNSKGNMGVAKPIIYKRFNGKLLKSLSINRNGQWVKLDIDETPWKIINKEKELSLHDFPLFKFGKV